MVIYALYAKDMMIMALVKRDREKKESQSPLKEEILTLGRTVTEGDW